MEYFPAFALHRQEQVHRTTICDLVELSRSLYENSFTNFRSTTPSPGTMTGIVSRSRRFCRIKCTGLRHVFRSSRRKKRVYPGRCIKSSASAQRCASDSAKPQKLGVTHQWLWGSYQKNRQVVSCVVGNYLISQYGCFFYIGESRI